jgi:hypothetical protein
MKESWVTPATETAQKLAEKPDSVLQACKSSFRQMARWARLRNWWRSTGSFDLERFGFATDQRKRRPEAALSDATCN